METVKKRTAIDIMRERHFSFLILLNSPLRLKTINVNMSRKIIAIATISLLYLSVSPQVWSGGRVPSGDDGDRSLGRASGSRGCPVELGELELVADNPAELKSTRDKPTLIYRVRGTARPLDFLIVVADGDGNPVFERRIALPTRGGDETIAVGLDKPLEIGQSYKVTAGLLCEGRRDRATVLTSFLTRIIGSDSTTFDRLADRYRESVSLSIN
jgi:Domain of Unknown Function (DUF928)